MSIAKKKSGSKQKESKTLDRCLVYIYKEQHKYLKEKAEAEYLTVSNYIRRMIKREMDGAKGKNGG